MFGYSLIAGATSKIGKNYAELFATDFLCTHAFPMKKKVEAHEALSIMFQRDGVPPQMIVDGSKEQMRGDLA